ncbi:hypothetical protein [Aquamicrobium zhengzhouense]|uniref:Peptidase M41 domain-containing protein n=1 Tax=Aquamicrobium zhengzhouense TaxID=2781738 RepID=A0ABS0SBW9_9HYPH|nr:hypothetical protein [Aquamicrobium zhengzhouense]MBI1620804.1 hypothetical protein [Aquamicrobium zhengzhouense]
MSAKFGREPLPVIEELDEPPPDERTAWHEAGHAVIGHALGFAIDMVTVREPARVVYSPSYNASALHEIARSHAGSVGEMARLRCWSSGWPEDADEYLERVHAFQFGGCDGCQQAFAAWAAVGINSPIEEARKILREGQALALRLGQSRPVWLAIRALAAELMREHTLSGKRAHSIAEPFVKFGEFKNVEAH